VRAALALLAALLAGCPDDTESIPDGLPPLDAGVDAAWPPVVRPDPAQTCEADLVALSSTARYPGGGHVLTLRLEGPGGGPARLDQPACLGVRGADGLLPSAARAVSMPPGELLLLVPSGPTPEGTDAFLGGRPPTERIAALRWGAELRQLSGFTRNRRRLADRIHRAPGSADDALKAPDALADAAEMLRALGGEVEPGFRAVVVLADPPHNAPRDHAGLPILWGPDAARADALRAGAHYRVGVCADPEGGPVEVGGVRVELPASRKEARDAPCDPATLAVGPPPRTRRVELLFDAEQRANYERVLADASREDFPLTLRLGPEEAPIEASAHLRGQTSFACERRSYTVNLKGKAGRRVVPGMATDELLLLSMCRDEAYVNQHTADLLLAELDLFPLRFGYVELWLDGVTRGVYLVVEKAADALLADQIGARSVIRRRFDPEDKPADVKWARDGHPDRARAEYDAIVEGAAGLRGPALVAYLSAHIDLDQLLRFLAFNSLMLNGDYVDEVYFVATDTVLDGATAADFAISAWDPDDLYSACHHGGRFAIEDPHGLLYCVEGDLEKLVAADEAPYARYVEALSTLLADLPPERVDAALEETRRKLLPFLDDPDVAGAMVELIERDESAARPARARALVSEALDGIGANYRARHAELSAGVEGWRASR